MKSKIILKSIMIISCLLLSLNTQAQELQYEDITKNYEWLITPELKVHSKNMTLLQLENLDKPNKSSLKNSSIESHSAVINLDIKEPVVINLDIRNTNNKPYEYKYMVYERNKNGSYKKKGEWFQGNIYFGVGVHMYSSDGSIISDNIWICASTNVNYPYAYNFNDEGWEYLSSSGAAEAYLPTNIILYPDNTLSINNSKVRTYSHIVGIKSIELGIATAAKVSVKNLTISKPLLKNGANIPNQPKNNDDWKGNGTGFFIDNRGYIATNYHVIEEANDIEVEFYRNEQKQVYKAEVIQSDRQNDLAVLKIKDKAFRPFSNIPYNFRTNVVEVGTSVFALGYPMAMSVMGTEIKFTDGKISSRTGLQGDATVYQISVPIQPGNSGGPLFDSKCNLIGVTSSTLKRDVFQTENVNYAIKSTYLRNLVDALPVKLSLPNDRSISDFSLTEQIQELSDYVVLIKIK